MKYLITILALCVITPSLGEEQQSPKGMIDVDTWLRTPMGKSSLKQCGCHYDGTHIIIDEMEEYEKMLAWEGTFDEAIYIVDKRIALIEEAKRQANEYFQANTKAAEDLKQSMLQNEMQTTQLKIDKLLKELKEAESRAGLNNTLPSDP